MLKVSIEQFLSHLSDVNLIDRYDWNDSGLNFFKLNIDMALFFQEGKTTCIARDRICLFGISEYIFMFLDDHGSVHMPIHGITVHENEFCIRSEGNVYHHYRDEQTPIRLCDDETHIKLQIHHDNGITSEKMLRSIAAFGI